MTGPDSSELRRRITEKVDFRADGCWIWTGAKTNGYAVMGWRANGRTSTYRAHRVAYEVFVAPLAPGVHLHHECENRACVNPAHLSPTTRLRHIRLHQSPLCRRGLHRMDDTREKNGVGVRCGECRRMKQRGELRSTWAA